MPYKSAAQERWAHTAEGEKALGGPGKVSEWDNASKGMKLPARVAKKPTLIRKSQPKTRTDVVAPARMG